EAIALYQLHGWDPLTPVEETLRFLDDAAQAGKILYLGLSNFLGYQIQKYVDLADAHGLIRPVTVQPQYNLLARAIEWEIGPACQAAGLGLLPWSPLAAGDLDLSEDETRLLDEASDPAAPDYPYGERGQTQRDRRISGGRF